jgi:hypothetical protein
MDLILTPAAIALCAQFAIAPCDIERLNEVWAGDRVSGPPTPDMRCVLVARDRQGTIFMCRKEPTS